MGTAAEPSALDLDTILIRADARSRSFASRAAEHDRDGSFPFENFDELHAAGLLALTVPVEFDGQGAGLATLPRFQSAVGESEALLYTNDRLIFTHAEAVDAGDPGKPGSTTLIKYVTTNNAIRAVDIALGLIGNPGLTRNHPLERYHRDVLCSRIHAPQDDVITLTAGRPALGIS